MLKTLFRPMNTAPKDGTWILGVNNRGNYAVIIWAEYLGTFGWIHPFSGGKLSPFWNGGCGSIAIGWVPLPKWTRKEIGELQCSKS